MGTDWLQLFDGSTAELLMSANESELATFAEMRTRADQRGDSLWEYFPGSDGEVSQHEHSTPLAERLEAMLLSGSSLSELRSELINEYCFSVEWCYLDYWGCFAEVFDGGLPDSQMWERYSSRFEEPEVESSGRYLLTESDLSRIIASLRRHRTELTIMSPVDVNQVQRWLDFTRKHSGFQVAYHLDF